MSSSAIAAIEIEYPRADGKPVAESDFQLNVLVYARAQLRIYYRDVCKRDDVYVAGNLLIYYEQGNRKAMVAPDVFAVMGVPGHDRGSYLLWREGKAPDFVLEITSQTTRNDDQGGSGSCTVIWGCRSTRNTTRRGTIWSRCCRG